MEVITKSVLLFDPNVLYNGGWLGAWPATSRTEHNGVGHRIKESILEFLATQLGRVLQWWASCVIDIMETSRCSDKINHQLRSLVSVIQPLWRRQRLLQSFESCRLINFLSIGHHNP